jgi:glucose/arabinose dehydrogenase
VKLSIPWEITYGPDGYLWISEAQGVVSRVHPKSGEKKVVHKALDYADGSPLEKSPHCYQPKIGSGSLGLALHPDFLNPETRYVYLVHSYNSGTDSQPATRFKVVQLTWDPDKDTVTASKDIITLMPTGYDHLGGRLMAIRQNGVGYLYLTIGDNGISEAQQPSCYSPQSENPNNLAQDPYFKNGKIHRFLLDGSIPPDNPIPGNSVYTRGHRNPQGLMYNAERNIVYGIEHGDRTDDEINMLLPGKNYGWKHVRGYHVDNNFDGENDFIQSYIPDLNIPGDGLMPAMFSWCAEITPTTVNGSEWCTVAPSDGIYYGDLAIPAWRNSLLVVTLKDGSTTDQEVFQFRLNADGTGLLPAGDNHANPGRYFSEHQTQNGRLRDIAISPDGSSVFLINNGGIGSGRDKIIVYTYVPRNFVAFPNPAEDQLEIESNTTLQEISIWDASGKRVMVQKSSSISGNIILNLTDIRPGMYTVSATTVEGKKLNSRFIKS